MAYGVTLPLVPGLVERAGVGAMADVERHTGWITGVYTLALFLFAPAWGALADRIDRRWVLAAGLVGSSATLWALTLPSGMRGIWTAAAFVLAAAGIGVLPSLAVRISSAAGARQGWAMGRQAAAANLGQAVGAAATGSLFALAVPLPFLIAGGLTALSAGAAGWGGAARPTT